MKIILVPIVIFLKMKYYDAGTKSNMFFSDMKFC